MKSDSKAKFHPTTFKYSIHTKLSIIGGRGGQLVESSLFKHTRGILVLYLLLFKSECFPKNHTWKDPSRSLKSIGDQSSAEAETKASRGSYANHHACQKSIDSPPYTLPAPAGLFPICNKSCWLENSPLIISPESQPSSFVVHRSRRRKHTYRK